MGLGLAGTTGAGRRTAGAGLAAGGRFLWRLARGRFFFFFDGRASVASLSVVRAGAVPVVAGASGSAGVVAWTGAAGTVAAGGSAGGLDFSLGQATTSPIAASTAAIRPMLPQRMRAIRSFMVTSRCHAVRTRPCCYLLPQRVCAFFMAAEAPIYDLVLLLDTSAEAAARKKILADVDKLLATGKAETVGTHDWGRRKTAYEIDKKTEADYHLIQFKGPATVPGELDRVLRITDGVLRHRVIKLDPGTPPPPDLKASSPAPPAEKPAESAPEPEAPVAKAPAETEAPVEAEAPAE